MTGVYAKDTAVSAEKSRGEIERTLSRYGAEAFMYGWDGPRAVIQFRAKNRYVRFVIDMPVRDDPAFTTFRRGQYGGVERRSPAAAEKLWEQATRQRWRALALVVKAKLEAVAAGITTFESEFLAHIVLPDGKTFGEWAGPELDEAYKTGVMPDGLLALPETTGEAR